MSPGMDIGDERFEAIADVFHRPRDQHRAAKTAISSS